MHAGGGFFTDSANVGQLFGLFFMEHLGQISTIV
jgi:hypothetical protein